MEEKLKFFWQTYDKYVQTIDPSLRIKLSDLLKEIEMPSREKQLLRPGKGWYNILAWQVLRNQSFVFSNFSCYLYEGEIIIALPLWDRDIFITRIPTVESVSGKFLKPGFYLSHKDKGNKSDYEWNNSVLQHGITDERGLYLPLYDADVVLKLSNNYLAKKKDEMYDYFAEEKGWII